MASAAELFAHEARPQTGDTRKLTGAIYTPRPLAEWVAEVLAEWSYQGCRSVADFGCGEGALLEAATAFFPQARCIGVDADALAVARAKRSLPKSARLITEDVLLPTGAGGSSIASYWRERLGTAPQAVIMNPPWGAAHSMSKARANTAGFSLARGQFDTYDLFCELALQVVAPGAAYAFILPDSIFLPEHQPLREMLLRRTTLRLIARLGEGIFPNVYCGCAVIVGTAEPAPATHMVECLRLAKRDRELLDSASDYSERRSELVHRVPQARFRSDPAYRFDIDVMEQDGPVRKISSFGSAWTDPLLSRRGAEISKSGKVLVCGHCSSARPLPKTAQAHCLACQLPLSNALPLKIVTETPVGGGKLRPFIAGEDVRRFEVQASRWIRTDVKGIDYKAEPSAGSPRLLVRKTGIGLNAAIDVSGAYTNQVVFEYSLAPGNTFPFSYLHYVLGVLCSRTMFAYHLKRSGEMEWRSHPYVTQKTLAALPIPLPKRGSRMSRQAAAIAGAVAEHLRTRENDIAIEALVAGLYGLDRSDMRWVLDVLDEAADLDAMRRLRLPSATTLEPLRVE